MRLLFVMFSVFVLMFGSLMAIDYDSGALTVDYSYKGFNVKRSLVYEPIEDFDLIRDEIELRHMSIVKITLINSKSTASTNIVLSEDLNYFPANAKIVYNVRPQTNGRVSKWLVPILHPGEEFSVEIRVDGVIPEQLFASLQSPKIVYDSGRVKLTATDKVVLGQEITLFLTDSRTSEPINDALVKVFAPDNTQKLIRTSKNGKATFIATQEGHYSYDVIDYTVASITNTLSKKSTTSADSNNSDEKNNNSKDNSLGIFAFLSTIFNILPFVIAVILAIYIVIILINFFSKQERDDIIPPAPAVKPVDDSEGNTITGDEISPGIYNQNQSVGLQNDVSSSDDIKNTDESSTPPLIPQNDVSEDDEQIQRITETMLARRREQQEQEDKSDESNMDMPIEQGAETQPSDSKKEIDDVSVLSDELQSPDDIEIDDDAIKKTITELEQLRAQLKEKEDDTSQNEDIDYSQVLNDDDKKDVNLDEFDTDDDKIDEDKIASDMQKLLIPDTTLGTKTKMLKKKTIKKSTSKKSKSKTKKVVKKLKKISSKKKSRKKKSKSKKSSKKSGSRDQRVVIQIMPPKNAKVKTTKKSKKKTVKKNVKTKKLTKKSKKKTVKKNVKTKKTTKKSKKR